MAITISKAPKTFCPVYNENYFRLKDDLCSQADFKYIIKLYYKYTEASSYTLIGSYSQFPLQDGYIIFDCNNILTDYIRNDYSYSFSGFNFTKSVLKYKIEVYRNYYGSTETLIQTWTDLYAFDGAISDALFDNLSTWETSLIPTGSTSTINKSISNTKTELNLERTDRYTIDYFTHVPSAYPHFTNVGLVVFPQWYYYHTTLPTISKNIEEMSFSLGVGPKNVDETNWIPNGPGTANPLDNVGVTSYQIWLGNDYSQTSSKPITITLHDSASSALTYLNKKTYDRVWLVYKSKYGGWSYLLFNMKQSKTQDYNATTYNRRKLYNETYLNRGTTTISNSVSQKYTLNTDWVDRDEYTFYEDLFSSPQVYMLNTFKNRELNTIDPFLPVIISSTSTPIYQPNNDRMFQYTIDVEAANSIRKQRR